ncbi:helix-turn-helix domain-containing protein [Actinoplanes hulinensis]|uniref:Helix-turn-helix domain-containing protein n=1 Tax=Actinoplanes hulinensis TaxID=1144547 RepID=A0ABS7BB52_9ACTN|nr:helix-turn-helix domain-containing protein [Actinoplanes hulinensis]MBW6438295.1 helix-turn-helix domain-containing protein [Actinoplanes hulinensis]
MPKLGELKDIDLPSGPLRQLTEAVRACLGILSDAGFSLRQAAEKCFVTKNVMSAIANGQRKRPDLGLLQRIHELAEEHSDGDQRPPSLRVMERLHQEVIDGCQRTPACPRCGRPWESKERPHQTPDKPADSTSVLQVERDTTLPVPPVLGDRQLASDGGADFKRLLAADRLTDLAGILRHIGRYGDPAETAATIVGCHQDGLAEAATTIMLHAAQRPSKEIMRIVGALLAIHAIAAASELAELAQEEQ